MKEIASLDGGSAKKSANKKAAGKALKTGVKYDSRPFFAFAATLVLYLFAIVIYKKYPLGADSVLISDLQGQYAPFLALLRSKIIGLKDVPSDHLISYISYSFKLGLGKNLIGSLGYYMSSPFNLIYLFIDETQVITAVMAIIVLKMSLSSSFMCLFLGKRINDGKSLWPVLFGIMYAFSLYSQAFLFQIMWLDGYMLLPLLLYFTEKFIKEQKYLGLTVTLLVLFVSNYYVAYMVGIACFLYLCVRLFEESVPFKKALCIGFRYVLDAVFTALITAVLLVPVGLDTIRNADRTIVNHSNNLLTYSPLTFIHFMVQGEAKEFNDVLPGNYPFLFICIPVVMLMLLYFISPVFKGRERKIHAVCVIGAVLSTVLYPLDKAWQVFDDPNWYWHRQAFVFLPLFLIISVKAMMRIKELARKDMIKAALSMFAVVVIDVSCGRLSGQPNLMLFNLLFVLAYAGLLAGFGVEKWPDQLRDMPKMLSPLLSGIICFELVFAGPVLSSGIDTFTLSGGDAASYNTSLKVEQEYGATAEQINKGTGAFRAETEVFSDYTLQNYVEDGEAIYGNYNGLTFFNSSSNKELHHFTKQLGMITSYNYFALRHYYACPSVDSFFSVGAVSSRQGLEFYQPNGEDSYGTGLKFYENGNALPLAFTADKDAMSFDFYRLEKDGTEKDYIKFQNDWYRSMFPGEFTEDFFIGLDESVTGEATIANGFFYDAGEYQSNKEFLMRSGSPKTGPADDDPIGLEDTAAYDLRANMTTIYRTNSKAPIVLEYEFKAPSNDEIYCALVTGRILNGTKIYVNGIKVEDFDANAYYSHIFRVGHFTEGEDVKVTFLTTEESWSYLNIRFAAFDNEKFTSQMNMVNKAKVNTVTVSDGYAKFSVDGAEPDEMVLTTIPYEDGWQLYIDGAPAEIRAYQNALIAFDVPSGSHTAELVFTAPGLKLGAEVSCAGIVLLAAFIVIDKTISKKKKTQ